MKKILLLFSLIVITILIIVSAYFFINNNSTGNYNFANETINSLDEFYSFNTTKKYKDIRSLDKKYSKEDAKLDNCFIIGTITYNRYLYSQFMSDYSKGISTFLRATKVTDDLDVIIYDILYDHNLDKIFIVVDNTRDNSIQEEDKSILLREFVQIGEYEHDEVLYCAAFNDNINEDNFYSNEVLIITPIN